MKDIKEKVWDKNPKIRNPASRLPKDWCVLPCWETKEKSRMAADKVGRETGEESPVEYAGNRIERAEQRVGKESTSAAYRGGKKLAVKTYEKLKAQKQKQRETATSPLEGETGVGAHLPRQGIQWQRKGERKPQEALNSNRKRENDQGSWKSDGKNSAPCSENFSDFFQKGKNSCSLTEKASTEIHESSQGSKMGYHTLGSDCQAKCKDCKGNRKRIKSHGRSRRSCSESCICSTDGRWRRSVCRSDSDCGAHWRCCLFRKFPK